MLGLYKAGECLREVIASWGGSLLNEVGVLTRELRRCSPGGPVARSPPCSAEDAGSIPGQETRISHAVGMCMTSIEPMHCNEVPGRLKNRERLQKDPLPLLSCEDKERRWNQGEGSNQTPNLLAPCS